ncbi:ATP-binding protein [uncultured Nonlabens sp.]|uniref:ATP-binding protein n=1 Tax=uncultured Nonlabens sp. TaxID=859306 RepID=UPI00345A8311
MAVKDNGIGIPEDKQKDTFKLFTSLNIINRSGKQGNGIGLSTVKILVDKLGDVIKCDSQINSRTTFTFTIRK